MIVTKFSWLAIKFLLIIAITACSDQRYEIRVINQTEKEISGVAVVFENKQAVFGHLMPNGMKVNMSVKRPPQKKALVKWVDSKQMKHSMTVDLSLIPERYNNGVLTFTVLPAESIKVGFFIRSEEKSL